mgnify:CR=1 FL=1
MTTQTENYQLISLVGPTAVGKTACALALAKELDTEIISADSRQFYREMNLGTAKPTAKELSEVPHHFINSHSVQEEYDVGTYEREALLVINNLFAKGMHPILVGGSGLFVDAICRGLDELPPKDPAIRQSLNQQYHEQGLTHLLDELKVKDADYFQEVDQANPQRIIRALEVIRSTGQPFSFYRQNRPTPRPFRVISIGLDMPRERLYRRIDDRMDDMIAKGLFEEAKALFPFRHLNALQTVGYKEIFNFFEGAYDKSEAVRLLKRNSRRYAKRQLTWFRKNTNTHWFHPEAVDEIKTFVLSNLSKTP